MKKTILTLIAFVMLFSVSTFGQIDGWRHANHEISLGMRIIPIGIKDFQYKTKLNKQNWLRTSITDFRPGAGEFGFGLGIEKQKNLLVKSRITYGLEAGTYLNYDKFDNSFANVNVDLGIPIGVQIHLTKKLYFGVESRPSIGLYESYIDDETALLEEDFFTGASIFNGLRASLGFRF